jgi:sporulation protein YlmC with PRC-barrel domain
MRLSDSTVRGRTVISADGRAVGTIAELFISASDWRIESIRIEIHNDIADGIGASRTMFHRATIELPVAFIQSVSDAVVLTVDVEHLREAHRATASEPAPPLAAPPTS